jgi:hypothetical protein
MAPMMLAKSAPTPPKMRSKSFEFSTIILHLLEINSKRKTNLAKKELKWKPKYIVIDRQMPNYAETKLYEFISHDENGEPVVYRGHTTQSLSKRKNEHISKYRAWLKDNTKTYCTSYEVLKHGNARIELVRTICCNNVMEASRAEGLFIRELPTCVNIQKNYEKKEYCEKYYEANKETIIAYKKEYYHTNKDVISSYRKEYRKANNETMSAKDKKWYEAKKETILEKKKEYYHANKETIKAKYAEKVTCECGVAFRRNNSTHHRNTWKHINWFIHC